MCGGAIIADLLYSSQGPCPVAPADLWTNSPFAKVPSFNSNIGQTCCDDSLLHSEDPLQQSSSVDGKKLKRQLYGGITQRPWSKL